MSEEPPIKRATTFSTGFCDDPTCGLHVVARDEKDEPICEIIMSRQVTRDFIAVCLCEMFGINEEPDEYVH